MSTTRRLAAILAADVVGYSRLVSDDESDALARLGTLRRGIIEPNISKHSGRLFKIMGDGFLGEFTSAVQAVTCAIAIQTEAEKIASELEDAKKMRLRIGIHVGDVMVEGDDLMGDGVNIAARLERIAVPGGISISRAVHDQVRDRIDVAFDDKGEIALKNIARPVQVFAVAGPKQSSPKAAELASPLALPDKPSIAMLPFKNMSGDPEQEYFADGMVEDIITELSRFRGLFVIARNSSFTYKDRAVDIKQVGRELGVRYVLEGSVRKSGRRVRITGQLIEASTGAHLWADKFEGELQDAFDLQDKVTVSVVGAIAPRLVEAEVERAKRKPPDSWDAYDFYLRGLALYGQRNAEANEQALPLFRKAIDLNPEFGLAYTRAAACLALKPTFGGVALTDGERSEAIRFNDRALTLEPADPFVLGWASLIFAFTIGDLERGSDYVDRALALNPNLSNAWNARAWISSCLGKPGGFERSLEAFDRAIRLNPFDDWTVFIAMRGKCFALWGLGRYEDAIEQAKMLLARAPNDIYAWFIRWVIDSDPTIRLKFPQLRSSDLKKLFVEPNRSLQHRAMLEEAIDKLVLPE
jgi:TolB-like protein/class 3 adenylate cyclase